LQVNLKSGGVDHRPWLMLSERHRDIGLSRASGAISGSDRQKSCARRADRPATQNLISGSRKPTTDPRAQTTITAKYENAAQHGPSV
jgi:hypothetical protein